MIFVSIALLAVAAVALGIGIVSSSVPPLVVSILVTLGAAGILWASFVRYRGEAAAAGDSVPGLGGSQPRQPGWPGAYAVDAAVAPASAAVPLVAAPSAPAATVDPAPAGWDDLPDADAADQVAAFNLDELHALRRHEVEHDHRDTVLDAIDARIDELVALRKRLATR